MKMLIYCTKYPLYLVRNECDGYFYTMDKGTLNDYKNVETYNGEIVAECDYEVEEIKWNDIENYNYEEILPLDKMLEKSCLTKLQLEDYLGGKNGYAIHIKNLHIFDRPRNLSCYSTYIKEIVNTWWFYLNHKKAKQLEKAPQNMMYCYGNNTGEKYILISIHPEWLAKILNGEKTIEVRKKVLKEMMQNVL